MQNRKATKKSQKLLSPPQNSANSTLQFMQAGTKQSGQTSSKAMFAIKEKKRTVSG